MERRAITRTLPASPGHVVVPSDDRPSSARMTRVPVWRGLAEPGTIGSMTVTIRPARPGDEADILRLIKALADYEKALSDARGKASSIAKETREALGRDTEAEKAKVEAQLSTKLQEAETRIAATKTKALSAVNDIAAETASAVVGRLIGQDVSLADVKKMLTPAAGE